MNGPDKRQHERVPAGGVAIRVKFKDVTHLEQYYLRDISRGGIFLRARTIKPLHEQLFVVLALPDGSEVKLRGEVVHVVTPEEATPKRPSGMGVQFLDLTPEVKQQLEDYVRRLKTRSSQPFMAPPPPAPAPPPPKPAAVVTDASGSVATYEDENDQALLRRLCWLLAEGSVLGRPSREVFAVGSGAPQVLRREVYERMRKALAPEKPPRFLGAEESRAISRLLVMLESMTGEG